MPLDGFNGVQVNPGDPLTAQAWNEIVTALGEVYAELTLRRALAVQITNDEVDTSTARVLATSAEYPPIEAIRPVDPDGAHTLVGLHPGEWTIAVTAPGFALTTPEVVNIEAQTDPTPLDVTLDPTDPLMPSVFGENLADAMQMLDDASVFVERVYDVTGQGFFPTQAVNDFPNAVVLFHDPPAGTVMDSGMRAGLVVGASVPGAPSLNVLVNQVLPSTTVTVGQPIQILGSNFEFTSGSARVFFDGRLVSSFNAGSGDNLLAVTVPSSLILPPGGRNVALVVANSSSNTTVNLWITPQAQVITGGVEIVDLGVDPNPTIPGSPADFEFQMISRANPAGDVEFTLAAAITNLDGFIPPTSFHQYVDGVLEPLSGDTLTLTRDVPTNVVVRIEAMPDAGQNFDLQLQASAGQALGESSLRNVVSGDAIDEDLSITIQNISGQGYEGGTLTTSRGVTMSAELVLPSAGTYDFELETVQDTSGWLFAWLDPTESTGALSVTHTVSSLTETIDFFVQPGTDATREGRVLLKIRQQGADLWRTASIDLLDPTR